MIVMNVWRVTLAGCAALLLSLTGCAGAVPAATPGTDAPLQVAAAFYPFEFVAERVGGGEVAVSSLTLPGAEPHDVELTARQVASLATTDLLVYQSGFQPAVDEAVALQAPPRAVDAASFLTMLPLDSGHPGEDAVQSSLDPHTWLDPTNLAEVATHVRDALSAARPAAAATFAANADALLAELNDLDADFAAGLATCRLRTFITSHAAFGYLAHRYDLEQVAIRGLEPDVEPSAARIAEVQQLALANGVTTIFYESLTSPAVSRAIAADLGLATDVLDPLEAITPESRGSDYREVMRSNLTALQAANQCQ
jgi:zinc transport system substrate-binding protein